MLLQIDDWIFEVDVEKTSAYSAAEAAEHCTCANCRNFYADIDRVNPKLRPFLAQFGLNLEAPDRMSPIDYSAQRIDYDPIYYVFGRILQSGSYEMAAGNANIVATTLPNGLDGSPGFQLDVYDISLSWVLDEPFDDGVPDVPRRKDLLSRLFGRRNTEIIQ